MYLNKSILDHKMYKDSINNYYKKYDKNCEEEKIIYIKDKNIGEPSRVPSSSACLLDQLIDGTTTTIYYGSEVEPSIGVNPCDPCKIVTAYLQDRISNGGALEIGISYSHDFGKTWQKTVVPFQLCIGGIVQRASDPVLAYRIDGKRVFLNVLGVDVTEVQGQPARQGILVTHSDDDGMTWSSPTFVASSDFYFNSAFDQALDDKNWITTDPNNPCNAYIAWDRFNPAASFHSVAFLSKTIDGGETWFAGVPVYDATNDLCQSGLGNCVCDPNPAINARETNQVINTIPLVLPKIDSCDPKKCPCDNKHCNCKCNPNITKSCMNHRCITKLYPNNPDCKNYNDRNNKTNGDLLLFMSRIYAPAGTLAEQYFTDSFPYRFVKADIIVIRSADRGVTWSEAKIITPISYNLDRIFTCGYTYDVSGNITGSAGSAVRTGSIIFSVTVNKHNGNLYLVYMSDQFRADLLAQIALTVSYDGGCTWTAPVLVNRTPQNSTNPQAFTPTVTINDAGYIAITYYDFRFDDKSNCDNGTKTDYWMAFYKDEITKCGNHELLFVDEFRITNQSFIMQNGPLTGLGYMSAGDYEGLTAACGNYFYEIHTETLPGPFTDPIPLNPEKTLFLDNNNRTDPFVSILQIC